MNEDRFWSKVDRSGDCWEWLGWRNWQGRGMFKLDGKDRPATHAALQIVDGSDVPSGMCVCHHCDNPGCVRPDHLFISDHAGNMQDCVSKGRHHHGTKHHRNKLTELEVRAIRAAAGHITQRELGRMFNVRNSNIDAIHSRTIWKHV